MYPPLMLYDLAKERQAELKQLAAWSWGSGSRATFNMRRRAKGALSMAVRCLRRGACVVSEPVRRR